MFWKKNDDGALALAYVVSNLLQSANGNDYNGLISLIFFIPLISTLMNP